MEHLFKRIGVDAQGRAIYELIEEGLNIRTKKVQAVEDDNGCLTVISHKGRVKGGHLQIYRNDKLVYAHRYIWALANGKEIPEWLVIRHSCDVPDCINPLHLKLGTQGDNVRDMVERGRQAKGEKNGNSTISDLSALLATITDGTQQQTAELLGCNQVQISRIRSGKQRPYIKAYCDTKLPNVKIPMKYAIRLKWLFDDITECSKK